MKSLLIVVAIVVIVVKGSLGMIDKVQLDIAQHNTEIIQAANQ